jgi:hypothetical protein
MKGVAKGHIKASNRPCGVSVFLKPSDGLSSGKTIGFIAQKAGRRWAKGFGQS